jgi:5-methylcytosine-specific restriction endonuclease McrA
VISQLPYRKNTSHLPEVNKRVLYCDPLPYYNNIRHKVNHYKRYQAGFIVEDMFPTTEDKTCACGCGKRLTGRRTRWATDRCSEFAVDVFRILKGDIPTIKKYLAWYYGKACSECGECDIPLDLEHTTPVKYGGGGCWLSNFTLMCSPCHREKTKIDMGSEPVPDNQIKLF